ncbi:MAG: phosphate ABC transporter permease PstA [Bifidobacteriaceae bacterium]|jgi:phosphate transport system permease protein|nr:phosphate ABC transporter permease PstA [Bifidobacteriaceae bacterium]
MSALATAPPDAARAASSNRTVAEVLASSRPGPLRRAKNSLALAAVVAAVALTGIPLVSVIWESARRGFQRIDPELFTNSMRGVVGQGGGLLHALTGTVLITGATALIAVPLGLGAAVFLTEYGGQGKLAGLTRRAADIMVSIPSIVAGLAAYALFSLLLGPGTRSGLAGAVALAMIMIPVVVRSSEEVLRLVPQDLREAGLALGAPKWKVIRRVVLPTALPGLTSGAVLGVARIIGETAPLLLVAGFTDAMNYNLAEGRMATLPVFIYTQWSSKGLDTAAYDQRAWAGALVLMALVVVLQLAARYLPAQIAKIRRNR